MLDGVISVLYIYIKLKVAVLLQGKKLMYL